MDVTMDTGDTNASEMLARIYSMFALPTVSRDDQVGVACPFCPEEEDEERANRRMAN